jgi:hypothetical protein
VHIGPLADLLSDEQQVRDAQQRAVAFDKHAGGFVEPEGHDRPRQAEALELEDIVTELDPATEEVA